MIQFCTLIVPYYRNPIMLRAQIQEWEEYPPSMRIIVVDDGSPEPAYDVIKEFASTYLQARISLYRIQIDIPWNRGGARNLGTREARTDWIVHVDIDHVLPARCVHALLRFHPNPQLWYRFERYRKGMADETRKKDQIPDDVTFGKIHPHMDSYLVQRHMYWSVGGYDEDYSGCLGGGSPFVGSLTKIAQPGLLPSEICLHVYTRTVAPDASDNTLSRDRTEYARRKKEKTMAKNTVPVNPLRFPWIKEELNYPEVVGEFETVRKICKGFSISRFGDGELKVLDGHGYTRELKPNADLTAELRAIAAHPHEKCLVAIPTMDPRGTKYDNWKRHKLRFMKYFRTELGIKYYSSLMTRPDCGEWLETKAYYEAVIKIWDGKKRICVVSEPESKLLAHVRSNNTVTHVECPMYNAYSQIDRMEKEVIEAEPDIVLLSVGVTATCLAHRLCKRGIQAVDLGSIGGFLLRWKAGGPKPKSYAEERGS